MIQLDPHKAAVLFKHLVVAHKKIATHKTAHTRLSEQLDTVKKTVAEKPEHSSKEFDKLEHSIAEAIDIEKQLVSRQHFEHAFTDLLKEKLDHIGEEQLVQKISVNDEVQPQKGIVVANKKPAKKKSAQNKNKEEIAKLKKRFLELKEMQNFDKKELVIIQKRILNLKKQLHVASH